jgi:hypothetical protein
MCSYPVSTELNETNKNDWLSGFLLVLLPSVLAGDDGNGEQQRRDDDDDQRPQPSQLACKNNALTKSILFQQR